MAKIEQLDPRINMRDQWLGSPDSIWRRPVVPAIRWGAVIAGVAVGLSLQLVLALLWMAMGFAGFGTNVGSPDDRQGIGGLIWTGLGMLVASFVSGFVSARMSGLRRKTDGVLHGAVSWAVATLLLAALAGFVSESPMVRIMGGDGINDMRPVQIEDNGLNVLLRGMIGGDVSVADMQTLERYVRSGQREEATLLLSSIGMDPVYAATVVDQAIYFARNSLAGSSQNAPLPFRTAGTSSMAVWAVFGGVFFSLLLSMAGGIVGAIGSRRLVWSKAPNSEEPSADKMPQH